MSEIITLRLKKEDKEHLARLLKLGKYRSRAQILREGLRILRDREESKALFKMVLSKKPKPKTTLEEVIQETDENWVSKGESGNIIDEMRER